MTDELTARLHKQAARYASDKARLRRSRDDLADLVRMAVRGGMSEVEAHKAAGVSRMTIRNWVGK